jgi:hypothetical protein
VGYPLDIVVCTALGVDMYDCVYPTRTARFGTALVHSGLLKLKSASMATDHRPIDETCPCHVCATYSRAYLHVLLKTEAGGPQLLTVHNIAYMMRLTREMRAAVAAGAYADYARGFVHNMFGGAEGEGKSSGGGSGAASGSGGASGSWPPRGFKRPRAADDAAAAASADAPAAAEPMQEAAAGGVGDGGEPVHAAGAPTALAEAPPPPPAIPQWVVDACAAAGFDVREPPTPAAAALFSVCPGSIVGSSGPDG